MAEFVVQFAGIWINVVVSICRGSLLTAYVIIKEEKLSADSKDGEKCLKFKDGRGGVNSRREGDTV